MAPYYGGSCEKDITWQDVELTSNGLESLLLALPRTKIRALDLSRSIWVAEQVKLLADAIPRSRVTDLRMGGGLDDFGFLAKVLSESNLQSLRLMNGGLNVLALKELAVHLPKSHLKQLHLFQSFQWEVIQAQANIFEDFAASLAKSQLKELTLGGYGLAKED